MWILRFKPVDCKNCYKCVRNCPVKAIRVKNQSGSDYAGCLYFM